MKMKKLVLSAAFVIGLVACGSGPSDAASYVGFQIASAVSPITPAVTITKPSSTVGPLLVNFDATGTTDSAIVGDVFTDLHYTWNFGDSSSPDWTTGTRTGTGSGNIAYGPVVGHVFEPALGSGTTNYAVTLTVTDGTNTYSNYAVGTVSVTDPNSYAGFSGTNTLCVSPTGVASPGVDGCPVGAATATGSDFGTVVNANIGSHKRILFHRGETGYTFGSPAGINGVSGPYLVGSYGTGADPNFAATSSTAGAGNNGSTVDDWRIMDLSFDGSNPSFSSSANMNGFYLNLTSTTKTNLLFLRITTNGLAIAAVVEGSITNRPDNIGIVGGLFQDIRNESLFGYGHAWTVLGTTFTGGSIGEPAGSQPCATVNQARMMGVWKSAFSNNYWYGVPNNCLQRASNLAWRTHGADAGEASQGTYNVISENKFDTQYQGYNIQITTGKTSSPWTVTDHTLIENNWFLADTAGGGQAIFANDTTNLTVRGNIIDMTGATGSNALLTSNTHSNLVSTTWYGNTVYDGDVSASTAMSLGATTLSSGTFENNLFYTPNDGTPPSMFSIGSGNTTSLSNNTCNTTGCTTNVGTSVGMTVPPTTTANYKPTTGYAIGGGASVPVWYDFFDIPWSGSYDIGAIKH